MEQSGLSGGERELIRKILIYLLKHPEAKDTREGVLKWWIDEAETEQGKNDLQNVLNGLVSLGWLKIREISSSEAIYGLNKEKTKEITQFLKAFSQGS